MEKIIEVEMRDFGDVEICEPLSYELNFGQICILKTSYGFDYGKVISAGKSLNLSIPTGDSSGMRIVRKATPSDLEQISKNRIQAKNAIPSCREKVLLHVLPMRVLASEYSFERQKIIFYYTAPGRVDFRGLLHDLAVLYKTRIELRQIGPRDEAKILGGIAPCGKTELCCTQFMKSFDTITTRMAKIQRLPVHQEKLLGLCGQLKCCLKFELDTYEELSKNIPKVGVLVSTRLGQGRIVADDILRQSVLVRLEDDRELIFPMDDVKVKVGLPLVNKEA